MRQAGQQGDCKHHGVHDQVTEATALTCSGVVSQADSQGLASIKTSEKDRTPINRDGRKADVYRVVSWFPEPNVCMYLAIELHDAQSGCTRIRAAGESVELYGDHGSSKSPHSRRPLTGSGACTLPQYAVGNRTIGFVPELDSSTVSGEMSRAKVRRTGMRKAFASDRARVLPSHCESRLCQHLE